MKHFLYIMKDGGPAITYTIILLLLVMIALFLKNLIQPKEQSKVIDLISSIAWFAVAWGFLGRTFGLIRAFDMIEATGDLAPNLVAEGIKMGLVGPLFGIITFLIARLLIIILILKQK